MNDERPVFGSLFHMILFLHILHIIVSVHSAGCIFPNVSFHLGVSFLWQSGDRVELCPSQEKRQRRNRNRARARAEDLPADITLTMTEADGHVSPQLPVRWELKTSTHTFPLRPDVVFTQASLDWYSLDIPHSSTTSTVGSTSAQRPAPSLTFS